MNIFFYRKTVPRIKADFFISGLGIREELPTFVDHFNGTNDYLLVFFYDDVYIRVDGEVSEYPAGSVIVWDDGVPHYYGRNDRKWQHTWLNFHGDLIPEILRSADIPLNEPFPLNSPGLFENYFLRLQNELQYDEHCDLKILEYNFRAMLLEIARLRKADSLLHIPEHILNCRKYIEANPEKKIPLETLARMAFLSVPHFCAEFKRYFSVSPGAYQMRLRMEIAKHLLRNHNLQVRNIAGQLGYADKYQFSKIFKRKTGYSPVEYRKSIHL